MGFFIKTIHSDSEEYKILKKISTFQEKDIVLFLPIEKEVKKGKKVDIYQKQLSKNVMNLIKENKWNNKKEWNCWKQIVSALHILHKNNILHFDVHLENIMVNKNKFYLIDFGISKLFTSNKISKYHQLCLDWKEDEFQLLWNLVFHHNQYPTDFSTFRNVIRNDDKEKQKLLEKEIKLLISPSYSKKMFSLFISNKPISLDTIYDKTKCKMFLYRLFLLYHIFIYKPDPFHQKMIHSFFWKKF